MTRAVPTWEDFYPSPRSFPELLRWNLTHSPLVSELVAERRGVLEIGVGTGMLSTLISKFADRVVTVDNSEPVLRTAVAFIRSSGAGVAPVLGDAFALPFASGSFGASFSQGLLEHFDDTDVRRMVVEQLRVAEVAWVSIPSAFYPHIGRWGPGLVGNERLLTRRRWERALEGWRVESRYYADYKVASFAGLTLPWPAHVLLRISRG